MHRITETCAVGIDYGVTKFEAGQLVDDDLGRRLAAMGVPVDAVETDLDPATGQKAPAKKAPAKKPTPAPSA